MAEKYKFFNSGIGDARMYEASDFADYFGSLLSTGFLHTNEIPGMLVSVETGTLNTIVSTGKAIMKGHMYENTTPLTLAHDIPEPSMDRIDRVVLRLNLQNAERNIKLFVIKGVPAANPIAPTLRRDNFIYELSLAQIRVRANTVQLLTSDLVDERLIDHLGGLVSWLPKIPTSQLQQQWDDFMASVTDTGFATAENFIAHKKDDTSHVYFADDTGTANVKAVAISSVPTMYNKGLGVSFTNKVENTGAVTLNVNGLGAKPVIKSNGLALIAGNLKAGSIYTARYNGTSFVLQGEGGSGNATASDLLSGKKASTDAGDIVGTMPNNGAGGTVTPGTTNQSKPSGYYSSPITVVGDADLIAANILKGKNIFGVDGVVDVPFLGGKRFATGIASMTGFLQNQTFITSDGETLNTSYAIIIGGLALPFTPTSLIAKAEGDNSLSSVMVLPEAMWDTARIITAYHGISDTYGDNNKSEAYRLTGSAYMSGDGFKVPVFANPGYTSGVRYFRWWLFE